MTKKTPKKEYKSMAAELGSRGGKAIVAKRGKGYMKKLSKMAVKARWSNKKLKDNK